jgi:hypothetical protein
MRFPVRRVLLGFTLGAAAGWVAGLLRTPTRPPEGSSADEATRLPQEEFGTPADGADVVDVVQASVADEPQEPVADEHPPPRKKTAPTVKRSSGTRRKAPAGPHSGASEPAAGPEATAEVVDAAAAALREGHAVATERLADAEAEAVPVVEDPGPARRRRRKTE